MEAEPDQTPEPRHRPQSVLREPDARPSRLTEIRQTSTWRDMIEGQPQHLGFVILMVAGAFAMLSHPANAPHLLGLTAAGWGQISILLAVIHQAVVALGFRLELHRGVLTEVFEDRAMRAWGTVFIPLLVLRPVTVILTGWADLHGLVGLRLVEWIVGAALIAVAGWALYSVFVHFTLRRALGGDHFSDEVAAMPLVDKGAFAVTPNAMYGIAFLGLWGIAILFGSWNALVVALFQHVYIWVQMYCTEAPDMGWIYGDRLARSTAGTAD